MEDDRRLLGLVFALPMELAPLKAQLKSEGHPYSQLQTEGLVSAKFHFGSLDGVPVALVASGIGAERAKESTRRLLLTSDGLDIKAVLSLGYAGALREGVKTGELVIAHNILRCTDMDNKIFEDYPCHSTLIALTKGVAEEKGFKVNDDDRPHAYIGNLLSVAAPLSQPEEKKRAGQLTGAIAADMESAGVAMAAREAQIPFLALKVIVDEVDEELKGTELVNGEGKVNFLKAIVYLLYHPWDITYFIKFQGKVGRASGELTRFLLVLVKKLAEGPI